MLVVNGVEVLDVREAATYVKRTPETVRRWVWSGRVPHTRRSNRLLIARTDLDAAMGAERAPAAGGRPLTLAEWSDTVPRRHNADAATAAGLITENRWADDHGR